MTDAAGNSCWGEQEMRHNTTRMGACSVFLWIIGFVLAGVPAGAWPVPDSGQTQSYLTGDDGAYAINPPSYSDHGDGTVTDNVTTLMWQQQDDGTTRNLASAEATCEALTLGGYSDWRLPTVQELNSLLDRGHSAPAINQIAFPPSQDALGYGIYWSATVAADSSAKAWYVHFYDGEVNTAPQTTPYYVRCVRGEPASGGFGPLVINNGATATDVGTGLTWQRQDDGLVKSWQSAIGDCEGLTLDGFGDWRLPTVNELQSLVDYGTDNPAIDATIFPGMQPDIYWSSTVVANDTSAAWYIWFVNGYVFHYSQTNAFAARCVRGGDTTSTTTTTTSSSTQSTTTTTMPGSVTLAVGSGWNLLSSTIGFEVATLFANPQEFTSAWKWTDGGAGSKGWAVYLSDGEGGLSYAVAKGFVPLTAIASGEGFWLNSKTSKQIPITGTPIHGTLPLAQGWNLVGLKSAQAALVTDLTSGNAEIISLWKWVTATWAVSLPNSPDGGQEYATGKGFLLLTAITPGEGFWVNTAGPLTIP